MSRHRVVPRKPIKFGTKEYEAMYVSRGTPESRKEAELWQQDLMHYCRNTGIYASRERAMLRHYHPDRDYLGIVDKNEMGRVSSRYVPLPAYIHGHRVNTVMMDVWAQVPAEEPTHQIWEGHFHCINCKLMGGIKTLQEYTCR